MITYPYTPLPPQYLSVQKKTKQKQCTNKNKQSQQYFETVTIADKIN
jgi:hypothetical protein